DRNFGRPVPNRRQLNSLQNTCPYGYRMPNARPTPQDPLSRTPPAPPRPPPPPPPTPPPPLF
ncbi:hypothetical protein ACVGXE_02150, partial [Escherichia coli]